MISAILFVMSDLINSFTIMWQGMLTIFVVMCLISLIVAIAARTAGGGKSKGKSEEKPE